jgi:hypothetical protein
MTDDAGRVNRRLTARITCHLNVSYRTVKDWHPALAMDLSPHGCRLRLGEDLDRGRAVSVRLSGPSDMHRAVEVRGAIIWSRMEGLSYQCGVQFSEQPGGLLAVVEDLTPQLAEEED